MGQPYPVVVTVTNADLEGLLFDIYLQEHLKYYLNFKWKISNSFVITIMQYYLVRSVLNKSFLNSW